VNRLACAPRPDWQQLVTSQGLVWHTPEGQPYWDESACYVLTMAEVLQLEEASNELQRLCLAAGQHIVDRNRFADLGLSAIVAEHIRAAWDAEPPAIYGRMDLAYDRGSIKLLEYNADTPTSLLESAVIQWYWKEQVHPGADQWNSIHERLVDKWRELRSHLDETVYFAHADDPAHEDLMTVTYLRDTASEAGIGTIGIGMKEIGYTENPRRFVDLTGAEMRSIFKLYPWEWMVDEAFAEHLFDSIYGGVKWIEPIWKMMWSNKGLLPILWELFPDHPLLLPAYFDGPRALSSYVRKPRLSREGANITVFDQDRRVLETPGEYGADGFVYQGLAPIPSFDGRYAVLGSWIIDGVAAGCGIRESDTLVTGNGSRFVPHYIDG
jgi:glutathionylspermidine synthase